MDSARFTDQRYLRGEQYRDAGNLRARMALHERFSTNRRGWHPWVFDQFDLPDGARVLELGCGPGRLWQENAARLPASWRLTLTDASPGMVGAARAALRAIAPALAVAVADAQALPCADRAFDAVIANHMLYHVPDRARAFAEVRRVLRPGGRFYAATNGATHLRELDALLASVGLSGADHTLLGFRLENGREELAPFFPHITLREYEDALVVTEAAPLLAYARSMVRAADLDLTRLGDTIARRLAADGAIRITKATGLFIARAEG